MSPNDPSHAPAAGFSRREHGLRGLPVLCPDTPHERADDGPMHADPAWFALPGRRPFHASDRRHRRLQCPVSRPWWGRDVMRQITAFLLVLFACGLALPSAPAYAEPGLRVAAPQAASRSPWAPLIAEAAARFAVPQAWLMAVLAAESGGDPAAVSPAGAMGLMQLMPGTWRALSRTYGLGDDPFSPRANILAGAAYLRVLHDRFGSPGFLAAYNAGPGRYEAYRRTRRPLPAETVRYVARLAARLALPGNPEAPASTRRDAPLAEADWRAAPLFPASPPPPETASPTGPATVQARAASQRASLFPPQRWSLDP